MSRRIEVELTSRRDDGTWTWRAAGAREPRGLVDAALLPAESKVGDNLRVEIEQFIDGIGILAVLPPRSGRTEPQRLELLGPRTPERLVTTTVTPRGRRDDRDRPRRPRDEAGGERRGERRDGPRRPDGEGRPRRPGGDGEDGRERRSRPAFDRRPPLEPKPRPKRIRPGRTHRRELIAGLPEEQRPIAEELSKGGIPGVRAALDAQNAQARSDGQPEINPAPLLALAEELWPRMRTAEWRDRAEAAWKEVDELDLRDLRSVVVAADSGARDEETRALAGQLRDALTRRVDEEHLKWLTELAELVADNRIVAALRRSSRPPKAGAPLPSDLARLLIDGTSEALNADVGADRWAVLLDALSFSPVRSSVTPAAVPEHPNEEMLGAVRRSASRLPHIAALFGIEAPPTPPPSRSGGRRSAGRTGGRDRLGDRPGGGRGGSAPIPPPPAEPAAAEAVGAGAAGSEAAPEVSEAADAVAVGAAVEVGGAADAVGADAAVEVTDTAPEPSEAAGAVAVVAAGAEAAPEVSESADAGGASPTAEVSESAPDVSEAEPAAAVATAGASEAPVIAALSAAEGEASGADERDDADEAAAIADPVDRSPETAEEAAATVGGADEGPGTAEEAAATVGDADEAPGTAEDAAATAGETDEGPGTAETIDLERADGVSGAAGSVSDDDIDQAGQTDATPVGANGGDH